MTGLNRIRVIQFLKRLLMLPDFRKLLILIQRIKLPIQRPFTLLIEHDSVFNKRGIYSVAGSGKYDQSRIIRIIQMPQIPCIILLLYHLLTESRFLDDFVGVNTNYTTYSEIPLNINGAGLDILINQGKEVFDTTD